MAAFPLGRHLPLLHGFEQGALRFWCCPIDLVGQYHLGEDRPGKKSEFGLVPVKNRNTDDVGRQHVAGELDP